MMLIRNLPPSIAGIAVCLLAFSATQLVVLGQTRVGFYDYSCPNAEDIVRNVVSFYYRNDQTIAAGLLRMHFHDCFVRGCDGSVLIDGSSSEKTAVPNLTLRGFEVIDDAKEQLESVCPGVVSCSDILALAARDSVSLAGGPGWNVPTGRRDGFVSSASDANSLPSFTDSVDEQKRKFADVGLNTRDLVALVGTIGRK